MVEAIFRLGIFVGYSAFTVLFALGFFFVDMYCSGRALTWNVSALRRVNMTDIQSLVRFSSLTAAYDSGPDSDSDGFYEEKM